MAAVRLNMAANFASRVWTVGLGFVFIPIYLRFLGVEAYGLVGFFATLQGVFGLLDLGLSATANREMARLQVDGQRAEQRDLLRTLEVIYWSVAAAIGTIVAACAPVIAERWITLGTLSTTAVITAIRVMGVVIAMQFAFGFYQGALFGLGRQVFVNGVLIVFGTLRSAGAALVLWRVSPTVEAFFLWQAVLSVTQTLLLVHGTWKTVPGPSEPRFQPLLMRARWAFAASMAANALVGATLTQLDKLLLTRLLPLEQFGYYMIATAAASVVWVVIVPVNQALFPRFTELLQRAEDTALRDIYHRAAQVMSILVVPLAATVALFSHELLVTWTRDAVTASHTALIVQLLIIGTALNGIVAMPAQLQAAAGWPQLMMYINMISAVVLVPTILLVVPRFGAPGAAAVWLLLNAGYVFTVVPLMHRRLLKGEFTNWLTLDVLLPTAAAVLIVASFRAIAPSGLSDITAVAYIGTCFILATAAAAATSPIGRSTMATPFRRWPVEALVRLRSFL